MRVLVYRAMGAVVLDPATYENVEGERRATWQAFVVVLISSLAAGIGAGGLAGPRLQTLVLVTLLALMTWLVWAALILYMGGEVFRERQTRVTYGELVRTIGFAAAPGALQAFALFPPIRILSFTLAWLWMLAAMVVAVRQALDYRTTWHAIVVCLVTFALSMATVFAIGLVFQTTVS